MPSHRECKRVPYSPEQMFDLVADVSRYPEFLPWCAGARILRRDGAAFSAQLTIGFGPFREHFTSHVSGNRPAGLQVRYEDGPFRYLRNNWAFTAVSPLPDATGHGQAGGCQVDFFVDFAFRNRLLQSAIGLVFGEAVRRMVSAFLLRAEHIYGAPMPHLSRIQEALPK